MTPRRGRTGCPAATQRMSPRIGDFCVGRGPPACPGRGSTRVAPPGGGGRAASSGGQAGATGRTLGRGVVARPDPLTASRPPRRPGWTRYTPRALGAPADPGVCSRWPSPPRGAVRGARPAAVAARVVWPETVRESFPYPSAAPLAARRATGRADSARLRRPGRRDHQGRGFLPRGSSRGDEHRLVLDRASGTVGPDPPATTMSPHAAPAPGRHRGVTWRNPRPVRWPAAPQPVSGGGGATRGCPGWCRRRRWRTRQAGPGQAARPAYGRRLPIPCECFSCRAAGAARFSNGRRAGAGIFPGASK